MPTPPHYPKSENTYIFDPESAAEMARLNCVDKLVTECMGGLFPEHPNPAQIRRILDIACGPGAWVSEIAFSYPEIEVVGVDISQKMIRYAQAQAMVQHLDNAHFLEMDAIQPLQFPDNHFDFVNSRFIGGFMSNQGWLAVINEMVRITHPAGIVRLTESDNLVISNSYALEKLNRLIARAVYLTGRSFNPYRDGAAFTTTPMLEKFLREAGCQPFLRKAYALDFSSGTKANEGQFDNYKVVMKTVQPFLTNVGVATQSELDILYDRLLVELLSEDFRGLWYFYSVWGYKPD